VPFSEVVKLRIDPDEPKACIEVPENPCVTRPDSEAEIPSEPPA
jgi:hypothetical protein